jgi:hypothetical protein
MFPVAVNNLFEIRRDDQSAVALLYPEIGALSSFGSIEGKVFRSNGVTPVQGANVIARRIDNPLNEAVSCVSDYLIEGNGRYTLFGLTPGDYKIEIEPIDPSFTGGSGVGPFTASNTDKSFQDPVPHGFFTGGDQTIASDENQALIVMVTAGQTLIDQNIIASTSLTTTSSTSSTSSSSSSSSSSSTGGGEISEIEPNDTVSSAQRVELPVTISGDASVSDTGEIELGSDTGASVVISDLFKFTLTNSTSINALLAVESSSETDDLDLVILDEFATDIIESSSQTGNSDELLSLFLDAGTYLIGVGAFSG